MNNVRVRGRVMSESVHFPIFHTVDTKKSPLHHRALTRTAQWCRPICEANGPQSIQSNHRTALVPWKIDRMHLQNLLQALTSVHRWSTCNALSLCEAYLTFGPAWLDPWRRGQPFIHLGFLVAPPSSRWMRTALPCVVPAVSWKLCASSIVWPFGMTS